MVDMVGAYSAAQGAYEEHIGLQAGGEVLGLIGGSGGAGAVAGRITGFDTPASGLASPVFRTNPGFVGSGLTSGGAREFVVPNGPIPGGALMRTVGP